MVELIADEQVVHQVRASVRQAQQGSGDLCCESETVFLYDRKEPLLLLRNKGYVFLKQGQYCLFIHFSPHSLIVLSQPPLARASRSGLKATLVTAPVCPLRVRSV